MNGHIGHTNLPREAENQEAEKEEGIAWHTVRTP